MTKGLKWASMWILFSLLVCSLVYADEAVHGIGAIKNVKGNVHILRSELKVTALPGMPLFLKDTIITDSDGSIGMIFKDNSLMSLGPDSHIEIQAFAFEPVEKKFSFLAKIMKGTLSYFSGLITRLRPESVEFRTPSAAISVRGTHLAIAVEGQ